MKEVPAKGLGGVNRLELLSDASSSEKALNDITGGNEAARAVVMGKIEEVIQQSGQFRILSKHSVSRDMKERRRAKGAGIRQPLPVVSEV